MGNKKEIAEIATNAVADIVEPIYNDLVHPAAEEIGKFGGRIPRFLNAICSSFDIWILKREHKVEMVSLELEEELQNVPPEKIVEPEPYVAVPALQAILYSYDSNELRSMYAHLLSKAMHEDYKNEVHPSFVEIIKQLSPMDCLILKEIVSTTFNPVISVHLKMNAIPESISDAPIALITNLKACDNEEQIYISLDNLERLNLVGISSNLFGLDDDLFYGYFADHYKNMENTSETPIKLYKRFLCTTSFGSSFSRICLNDFDQM